MKIESLELAVIALRRQLLETWGFGEPPEDVVAVFHHTSDAISDLENHIQKMKTSQEVKIKFGWLSLKSRF